VRAGSARRGARAPPGAGSASDPLPLAVGRVARPSGDPVPPSAPGRPFRQSQHVVDVHSAVKVSAFRAFPQPVARILWTGRLDTERVFSLGFVTSQRRPSFGEAAGGACHGPDRFQRRLVVSMVLPPPSDRLLAYMDILGWSEIVRDETRAGDAASAMLEVQAEKDAWEKVDAFVRAEPIVQMSEFSDCVVLSCDVNSDAAREQLLTRVCRLYLWWLERGFLCRGAIVVGRLVHTESVIYGSALVDAYRLERNLAVYPRIVVREVDLDRLGAGQILRMDDGVPFLNPMVGWFPPTQPSANLINRATLKTERGRWRTRLAELKLNPTPNLEQAKVIAKYEWLVRYLEKAVEMTGEPLAK
jgi:hypothetical protein